MCGDKETIDHVIGGCTTLAPKEYTERNNKMPKILHLKICETYEIDVEEKLFCKCLPQNVIETGKCKIL